MLLFKRHIRFKIYLEKGFTYWTQYLGTDRNKNTFHRCMGNENGSHAVFLKLFKQLTKQNENVMLLCSQHNKNSKRWPEHSLVCHHNLIKRELNLLINHIFYGKAGQLLKKIPGEDSLLIKAANFNYTTFLTLRTVAVVFSNVLLWGLMIDISIHF